LVPSPLGQRRGRGASAGLGHPPGEFLGLGLSGLDGCPGSQRKRLPDNVSTVGSDVGEFYAVALAYLFGFIDLHLLGSIGRGAVARKVFGRAAVDRAVEQVTSVLHGWGQRSPQVTARTASLVSHALLLNRSPLLADLSEDALNGLRENMSIPYSLRQNVHSLHRALAALGHVRAPRPPARLALAPAQGVDPAWAHWVQRWHDTSALPVSGRKGRRNQMLRMGRWLAAEHPDIREPNQ
jgi:hypothetical protein